MEKGKVKMRILLYFILLAVFWTILIAILAMVNYREVYKNSLQIVKSSAIDGYNKDLVYRRWATIHGGVYVPVTASTPPNPWLSNLPERDITTPSGKRLTLVNPAYMTRQVHELGTQQFGSLGHITSLIPIRPSNAPDDWEKKALLAFELGVPELASLEMIKGKEYFRFMKPMIAEQGCLKCHQQQGYKIGDVRGGISVSVPWEPVRKQLNVHLLFLLITYGGIWIIGLAGAGFIMKRIHVHQKKQAKMEDSIIKRERLYRNLFDKANEGLILMSMEGKLVEVNNSFAEMHGYTVDELKNFDIKELDVLNERAFKGRTEVMQRLHVGEIVRFEVEHYHKDGHIVTLSNTVSLINIDGQQFYLAFHQDISERRAGQEALQSSEKRYRTTLESISDAFFSLDNELRFTYFNKQAEELLLKKSNDVLGKQIFSEVFEEAKGSVFEEKYTHALAVKEISTFETFFGIEPYVNWYNVKVYPGAEGISVFFTVITEKKKADSALRLSLSKYQTLFDLFPVGITISDANGQIIETNSIAQHILGLGNEEQKQRQINSKDWQIIRPDGSPMPASEYASVRALSQGIAVENVEMGIRKGDDQVMWINVSATPIPIEGYGVAIVYSDLTARKQAEQELIIAKEKAEESDRLKSAFLSNMSHEIRTPMNGILGFAGLLKEPDLNGEEQQNYIRIIEKSGARMLNIINDIIDISKIEAGLMGVDLKESNINEQIEYIYTFFKPEVENKGMHLVFNNSLAAKEALIETDREKIYAILTNLVKNAIKYSNEGSIEFGYTLVETQYAASPPHTVALKFFVKDTGIGIAKDRQDAIFKRFIQADANDSHALQGAGLGLSITKAYVEMLGGKIWVDSEPGKGSTFYFTIPYNTKKQVEHLIADVVSQQDESDQMRNLKILIAEDDETSDLLLTKMLKKNNHDVLHTKTGIETVEICRNKPDLDLVLMDIRMPGMNGYEATRQIRQLNKGVIIIAQTAYGLSGDREKAIDAGCNDYISKPINISNLKGLIRKYFTI